MHELTKIAKRIGHTDKVDSHIYTEFYGPFLEPRRNEIKKFLEIGISGGGSLLMWAEFFPNAEIYGVDNDKEKVVLLDQLEEHERIHLYFENAYDEKFLRKLKGLKFDVLLDDGPHDVPTWDWFLLKYRRFLAKGGIMMVEDIFTPELAEFLISRFKGDKNRLSIIDRRTIPGAYRHNVTFTFPGGMKQTEFVTNELVLVYM